MAAKQEDQKKAAEKQSKKPPQRANSRPKAQPVDDDPEDYGDAAGIYFSMLIAR